jgi:hypothetical protein
MNNSFGIFTEDPSNDQQTVALLGEQCKKNGDTVIFTDNINSNILHDYSIFPSFYMRFFRGIVIFLNMEDYIQYKDNISGKPMLYLTEEMVRSSNIDGSLIHKNNVFSASGGYA